MARPGTPHPRSSEWYARLHAEGVRVLCETRVFHQPEPEILLAEGPDGALELKFKKLILATGARERFLPFPGWTLPNVMGAGGLQAMVKSGLPIAGKRVVVAGSGPLLLAVAAYLSQHGAEIPMICEQASWGSSGQFRSGAFASARKKSARDSPCESNSRGFPSPPIPGRCPPEGKPAVEEVVISQGGKNKTIACDYLACGFHLVPNSELAVLLGCRLQGRPGSGGQSSADLRCRESYCAGEPTGIGGLELSLVEGQIAGLAAAAARSQPSRYSQNAKS